MPTFPLPGPPYDGIALNGGQNPTGNPAVIINANAGGVPVLLNLLVVFSATSVPDTQPGAFEYQTSKLSSGQWAHWYWAVYDTLAEIGDGPSNEMILLPNRAFHVIGAHVCDKSGTVFDGTCTFASLNSNTASPVDQSFTIPFSAFSWAHNANIVHIWSTGAFPSLDNFQILQSNNYAASGYGRSTWLIGPAGIDSAYSCIGERSRSVFSILEFCGTQRRRNYVGLIGN